MKNSHKLYAFVSMLLVVAICLSIVPIVTMAAQSTRASDTEIGFPTNKQDDPAEEEDGDIRIPIDSLKPTENPSAPTEPAAVPGDFTDDGEINNDDVVLLLWHTLFPSDYPITNNGDLNHDGAVSNDDVVLLLWHTLFPNDYPLN